MADRLNDLLGWADFSESLFAQSRAVDEVKQYPAYGIALQAKVADINTGLQTIRAQAATNGIVVEEPEPVALTADYYGNISPAGQLPLALTFDVKLLGNSLIGDPRLDVLFIPDGLVGSITAPGTYTVTAVSKPNAILTMQVTFAGVLQGRWTTQFTVTKAAAPLPPPVDPDAPPAPPPAGSPSPTKLMTLASAPVGAGFTLVGSVDVTGGNSYRASIASELVPGYAETEDGNVEVYFASQPAGGSWTAGQAPVTGAPARIEYDYVDLQSGSIKRFKITTRGYVQTSADFVLPDGSFKIGLFARQVYNFPVNFADSALVEAL